MNAHSDPTQSTTVRPNKARRAPQAPARARALRAGLRWISPKAPSLAVHIAEHIFRTPPPRRSRPSEDDALLFADPIDVRMGSEVVPTWSFGEGPAVVLVHGWGGRGMQLRSFVEPLVRRGYRVVLFDGPGHGASRTARSSLPEVAAATRAVLEATGHVHAIIAHSMGAPAALLATEAGPRPKRLALLAPPATVTDVTARFARFLGLPDPVRLGLERALERRFLRPMSDLESLPIVRGRAEPVLVVHDREDREVPFEDGASLAHAARVGHLHVTSGLGHNRILRDESVVDTVVDFVDCA